MISVVFVCLGNICRSPMAEAVFKKMTAERGIYDKFIISSFGISDCEEGSPVYPPVKKVLDSRGITVNHTARQISLKDVVNADYVLVMDSMNLIDLLRLTGGEFGGKIFKLCSFTSDPRDVADPWYTRNFEKAYNDITDGCNCFLEYLLSKHAESFQKPG